MRTDNICIILPQANLRLFLFIRSFRLNGKMRNIFSSCLCDKYCLRFQSANIQLILPRFFLRVEIPSPEQMCPANFCMVTILFLDASMAPNAECVDLRNCSFAVLKYLLAANLRLPWASPLYGVLMGRLHDRASISFCGY